MLRIVDAEHGVRAALAQHSALRLADASFELALEGAFEVPTGMVGLLSPLPLTLVEVRRRAIWVSAALQGGRNVWAVGFSHDDSVDLWLLRDADGLGSATEVLPLYRALGSFGQADLSIGVLPESEAERLGERDGLTYFRVGLFHANALLTTVSGASAVIWAVDGEIESFSDWQAPCDLLLSGVLSSYVAWP
jgi:hypothetical protein